MNAGAYSFERSLEKGETKRQFHGYYDVLVAPLVTIIDLSTH